MKPQLVAINMEPGFDKQGKRQLQKQVQMAVAEKQLVILDVSLRGELNSQELAAIFAAVATIIESDGDVAIVGASPQLRTLFSLDSDFRTESEFVQTSSEKQSGSAFQRYKQRVHTLLQPKIHQASSSIDGASLSRNQELRYSEEWLPELQELIQKGMSDEYNPCAS